jgi:hypothetical protein
MDGLTDKGPSNPAAEIQCGLFPMREPFNWNLSALISEHHGGMKSKTLAQPREQGPLITSRLRDRGLRGLL